MADYVIVNGKPVELPVECETDMAERAKVVAQLTKGSAEERAMLEAAKAAAKDAADAAKPPVAEEK